MLRSMSSRTPAVTLALILASAVGTTAVAGSKHKKPSPLVIEKMGSFFVGGQSVAQTAVELGNFGTPGHITINQMYVEYMIPKDGERNVPVVMVHGGTLSGANFETTPDGRPGWEEFFLRKGHPVYNPDQVSRARSGFNQAVFNNVRAGASPPNAQPNILRISNEGAWTLFRFGPSFGVPYPDQRFPLGAAAEFAKQGIPDLNAGLPSPNPTNKALSDLAKQVGGAVLMGHSESGRFPLEAALIDAKGTKGLVVIEPGGCNAAVYTDEQIAKLAKVPILVVFGDHLDTVTGIPGFSWRTFYQDCLTFIDRIKAARGNAKMLYPPNLGIYGNSHMLMNDKNSDQIAGLIWKWIKDNVDNKRPRDRH